jgi:P4 family phage/plasmid primase-like protien
VFFNILFKQYQDYEAANINDAGLRNKIDGIRKAILNIRNHKKRKEYIDDIICKITNNNVKFDEKAHLFAFNNMIYNTQLMQFTKPDPLDYISMTTGYNYNEEYDNKKVVELETLINTILKEPTIKAFYMQILATGLIGQNLEKFVVCSGVGGNGKGLINGLAMAMFGSGSNNYSYKLKSSVLSEALKVGSNPEVANCHNKRFIVAQEPERDAKIKVSIMKELTGDDNINARLNHSNETNTKIKATLVLECNSKPKFDEIDDAVFRRLITVLFKSKFVDASMYDKEDETIDGIIDNKYKSQVWKDDYKQALFNIIIKHLETYNKNGLILPEEIINHNKKYMQESDNICEFIDENYIKTDNKSDKIPLKEVFNHYKIENTKEKYKDFRAQIEKNLFLKKHIIINKDDTYILMGYKLKDQIDNPLD